MKTNGKNHNPRALPGRGVTVTLEQIIHSLQDNLQDDDMVVAVVADLMWRGRLRRRRPVQEPRRSAAA